MSFLTKSCPLNKRNTVHHPFSLWKGHTSDMAWCTAGIHDNFHTCIHIILCLMTHLEHYWWESELLSFDCFAFWPAAIIYHWRGIIFFQFGPSCSHPCPYPHPHVLAHIICQLFHQLPVPPRHLICYFWKLIQCWTTLWSVGLWSLYRFKFDEFIEFFKPWHVCIEAHSTGPLHGIWSL